ncbi:MAG TPA: 3-isopropylmalate dehydrogenase [Candidatus Ornithospirochaeta stercorigallinarum]|nr:3-isopropylmalate dehydrogenase [Candidatus Ornithospirochaeta stercorigallinarum]
MKKHIAVIAGDGIGPDIINEAVQTLEKVASLYGHEFEFEYLLAGGASIDEYGVPLTDETLERARSADSVLLGAVGGPKWDKMEGKLRPEKALLGLRSGLGLFCNLRPALMYKALEDASPLKSSIIGDGIDIMIVRELTGGIYFGEKTLASDSSWASDLMKYSVEEIDRIARKAFDAAMKRRRKVTSVDKANVLETSRLWRKVVTEVAKDYPEVELNHMYVDNAAMQLVRNPMQFDVIVTENMFGDILSDEASMITGSIGMLSSASLGSGRRGMYEPIHGSAPDIAGKDIANPIATILSAASMLRYSFDMDAEAEAIENAVEDVINAGWRTFDIARDGEGHIGTKEMGEKIREMMK